MVTHDAPLVYTTRDLATKLQTTARSISRLVNKPGFPKPVMRGRWLVVLVDDYLIRESKKSLGHISPLDATRDFPNGQSQLRL